MLQPAVAENPIGDAAVELGVLPAPAGASRGAAHALAHPVARHRRRRRRPTTCAPDAPPGRSGRFQQANDFFREAIAPGAHRRGRQRRLGRAVPREAQPAGRRASRSRPRCAPTPRIPRRCSAWPAPWPTTTRRWRASWRSRLLTINPQSTPARTCCWRSWRSTTPKRRRSQGRASRRRWPSIRATSRRCRSRRRWPGSRSATADYKAATDAVLKLNPSYGEVYRVVGAQSARELSLRRGGGAGPQARHRRRPRELPAPLPTWART